MTEEEAEEYFIKFAEHLSVLRPIVDAFCARHGFERIVGPSVGRYPRVRLNKDGPLNLWIDLWMGLDAEGHRFTHFHPDLPYDLAAGASFQESDGLRNTRYQKSILIWSAKPFRSIEPDLEEGLESALEAIRSWDAIFLKAEGTMVPLP